MGGSWPPGQAISMTGRHQILSLTGGGFRGVFTAGVLARCESEWGVRCCDAFQLMAGTSVGGLLAAGLALGKSAAFLQETMHEHGMRIFPRQRFSGVRRLFGKAPYTTDSLRKAAIAVLGDQLDITLDHVTAPLILTAVNYTLGKTECFRSRGVNRDFPSTTRLIDAILASAAAPTFFPTVKIGPYEFADGGLVANAPDLVATIEALSKQNADIQSIYMLSVGTAGFQDDIVTRQNPDNPGIIRSLWGRKLFTTTMSAQENLTMHQIRTMLGTRHLRLDKAPDHARQRIIRGLDNASENAFQALDQLAGECLTQDLSGTDKARLRDFFVH